jgi:hypothetical protein
MEHLVVEESLRVMVKEEVMEGEQEGEVNLHVAAGGEEGDTQSFRWLAVLGIPSGSRRRRRGNHTHTHTHIYTHNPATATRGGRRRGRRRRGRG